MLFPRKVLLASIAALLASGAQAESLRDIYELALENDATLKAQQAQYAQYYSQQAAQGGQAYGQYAGGMVPIGDGHAAPVAGAAQDGQAYGASQHYGQPMAPPPAPQ